MKRFLMAAALLAVSPVAAAQARQEQQAQSEQERDPADAGT